MKKLITTMAVMVLANAFPLPSEASSATKIYVNGTPMNLINSPIAEQGRTLVEFRPLFEALGMTVNWDNKTQSVLAEAEELSLQLTINSNKALINGNENKLEVAPKVVKGRTLVPLRFVGETMGAEVDWNGTTNLINLTTSPGLQVIRFPDPVFEKVIRAYSNKPTGEVLAKDVEGITAIKDTFALLGGDTWLPTDPEPITNLEGIQYLVNLEELELPYYNHISNITMLQDLKKLRVLNLGGNEISDITPLRNLTNLEELNLGMHSIQSFEPLKDLTKLKHLFLAGNTIEDLSWLSNLTKLEYLNLGSTKIKDISPLSNLTALKTLYLGANQISDLSPLQNLTNLTELGLDSNQIKTIKPLAALTNLESLTLSQNSIDKIPALNALTKLKELYLNNNNLKELTGELNGLTSLERLDLANNQIDHIDALIGLTSLRKLNLRNNSLTKVGSQFSNLSALEELELKHNQIATLEAFTGLEKLSILSLGYNRISTLGSALNNLPSLELLGLEFNRLNTVEDLSSLTKLEFLNLDRNIITEQASTASNLQNLKARGVLMVVQLYPRLPDLVLYPNQTTVYANGSYVELLEAPYMKKFRTLIPLRFIGESLGAKINYYEKTQKIVLTYAGKTIELVVGSTKVTTNGTTQTIEIAPEVKNGTTFVPLRFVSEQLGAKIDFDQYSRQIVISKLE